MEWIGYYATAVISALAGAGGCYAILRNNIKGLKENEATLLEQLNTERDKMRKLMDKLIAKKNEA